MKIQIILGSTRPGRKGAKVAKWVEAAAKEVKGFEVELVDLADYVMPLLDEAISPRFNPDRKPNEAAARWLAKVGEADGYIVVTPEYNHSISAALKNAIDYLDFQIVKKPFAIVSYGTVGGARSAEHLKVVLIESKAAIVPEAVALLDFDAAVDEEGKLTPEYAAKPYGPKQALETTLKELSWWAKALKTAREEA
jgi:NAD(P)H-dependent FMN reductase